MDQIKSTSLVTGSAYTVPDGSDEHEINEFVKSNQGKKIVAVEPRYFRPTEVDTLLGDARKAKAKLGWQPKIPFEQLVKEMVRNDLKLAERDELIQRHGHSTPNNSV